MSLRNLRSFTILLVLELAVLESQVESFTLQRSKDTTDNVQAKSTVLEVLNKSTGNVKPIEIQTTQMVPTQTSAKTEKVQKNVAPTTNTTVAQDANATSTSSPVMTTNHKENSNSSDTVSSSKSPSSSKTPTSSSNTSTDSTTPGDLLKYSKEETPVPAASSTIENVQNVTTKGNETATLKSENLVTGENLNYTKNLNITNQINATEVVTANKINSTENVNSTSPVRSTNSSDKFNDTNVNIPMKNVTTDLNLFTNNTISKGIKLKTEENSTSSYSTKPVAINNTTSDINNSKDGSQNTTDDSNNSNTKINSTEKQAEQSEATEGTASSTEALTSDSSGGTTLPYWKKYTTIERKRVNTTKDAENNTVKDQDLLQAGTAQSQTTMSLEKALDIVADIPSLEQLKNDLIALNKMTSTTESTVSTESLSTKGTPKVDVNSSESSTSPGATTQGLNVFSSKRAGYLDFSSRSENNKEINKTQETMDNKPNKTEETIDNKNKTKIQDKSNVTEVSSNYSSSTPPMTTPKKVPEKSMTSQSQLAEDEIQEELMKEEILLDNVENAKRLQVDRFGARTTTTTGPKAESSSSSSEDKLRVRPISAEKKNGSLYAVNPNYKPLKKIEVQSSKPFLRNPDDNSWRNESLSSRGIVFKANNSSKPFTQVLKNITETKLNSLLENDNKGDEPELRTRLEKIAEMRKTKKKKVNALGETVYTDYEEPTSVENSNSSNTGSLFEFKTKDISAFLDQIEMKKPATTRGYNFDAVELTTKKSQKQIDDYEDDDDEDYTLPNIDLKKYFTPTSAPVPAIPSMSAGPLTSALPLPSRTYSPDRRPTVQYFPPRDKPQKVNINDYDTIFQQKINSYTTNIAPNKFTTPAPKSPPSEVTFDFPKIKAELQNKPNPKRPQQMDRNVYLTQPPQFQKNGIANPPRAQNGAGYNDPPYVIKHLRDFFDEMVKAEEAPPATVVPLQGITANEIAQNTKIPKDYFDYETQFRKDVINRFVENFNQNSERFKADYPVLYNTSVVHASGLPGGGDAESTAFMKRLYDDIRAFQPKDAPRRYDPNCDRTVELSPAYELHYYVPEEEEKQVVELKPATRPISRLRL